MKKVNQSLLKAFDKFKIDSKNQKTICGGYDSGGGVYGSYYSYMDNTSTGTFVRQITTYADGSFSSNSIGGPNTASYMGTSSNTFGLPSGDQ